MPSALIVGSKTNFDAQDVPKERLVFHKINYSYKRIAPYGADKSMNVIIKLPNKIPAVAVLRRNDV